VIYRRTCLLGVASHQASIASLNHLLSICDISEERRTTQVQGPSGRSQRTGVRDI
jgi:hypothetical protein